MRYSKLRKVIIISKDGNFEVKYERKAKLFWFIPMWISIGYLEGMFLYMDWRKLWGLEKEENKEELEHLTRYLQQRRGILGGDERVCDWAKGFNDCIQEIKLYFEYVKGKINGQREQEDLVNEIKGTRRKEK